jgi:hypothetical protein
MGISSQKTIDRNIIQLFFAIARKKQKKACRFRGRPVEILDDEAEDSV